MKRLFRLKPAILLAVLLTACGPARQSIGPELARSAGWRWEILQTDRFDLAAASAPKGNGEPLTVYLEGDGLAYVHPRQPALDPTPSDPVALRLALAGPQTGAVAWLGRPCQYTLPDHGRNCATPYWTTSRYAPEIVDGVGAAIDVLKARAGARRVVLVGYSGGGAIAMLLAARRTDVERVLTVAADLDLDYWTTRDGLSPLAGSLDPAAEAGRLGAVPQVHFTGTDDHVVGTDVVKAFLSHLPQGAPARLVAVPGFTHSCCWAEAWPDLAAESLAEGRRR